MSHVNPVSHGTNSLRPLCISRLLEHAAACTPDALAILAPGRLPLTYGCLYRQSHEAVQRLNAMGVGRNDRVALVLPNGPEAAVAFLAVAAGMTCAPLNPACSADEFAFYFVDLQVRALVVLAGMDSPARTIAQARGIPIIELSPMLEAEAGLFTLTGAERTCAVSPGFAQPDDVALVLHTSGTTSRPKIVPLTQMNICTSAQELRVFLALTQRDRCLNVLPLFHIFGLVGTILPALAAGASIVCTPGFSAPKLSAWLAEFRPTWYTGVPTLHQAILAHTALHREVYAECPLRFIRSGTSSLPANVREELEAVFKTPVIESYGMTEASAQITCNPLPPRVRKTGSVGIPVGLELAIIDEAGTILPPGEAGPKVCEDDTCLENNGGCISNCGARYLPYQAGAARLRITHKQFATSCGVLAQSPFVTV